MIKVKLYRDFKEDRRTSIEVYANFLEEGFKRYNIDNHNIDFLSFNPNLLISKQLSDNFKMRFARYIEYPFQIRKVCKTNDINHIAEEGYAHLMRYPLLNQRTIITVHDIIPLLSWKGIIPNLSYDHRPWLAEYSFNCLKNASHIIAISQNTKKDLIKYCGVKKENISVIYYGCGKIFKPLPKRQKEILRKKKFKFPKDSFLILITGQDDYKNHETGLKVLQKLREKKSNFFIVRLSGQSRGANKHWTKLKKNYSLNKYVIELENLEQKEVSELYNSVDCLLFPSWYEGFGRPPLEAMACGLPVVASNRASIPEVVGEAGLIYSPDDVIGMMQGIKLISNNEKIKKEMIEKGIKQSLLFTWEKNIEKTVKVYELINKKDLFKKPIRVVDDNLKVRSAKSIPVKKNDKRKLKILFISAGFVPEITPSDKKFVLDVVTNLSSKLDITIWSLNDKPLDKNHIVLTDNNSVYTYYNKNRIFHKHLGRSYKPHPNHSMIRDGLEINISLLWYLLTNIRSIIKSHKPDLIHLTDSFGPAVSIIKRLFKDIPVTINKPTARLNGSFAYNTWVKTGLKNSDGIFTYTGAAVKTIEKLGVKKKNIKLLPWGINQKFKKPTNKEINLIRRRYGCKNSELLIVVLPRVSDDELIKYINFIKKISISIKAQFVFPIRPTRYLKKFSILNSKKVTIESGPKDFFNLLSAADLAVSQSDDTGNIKSTSFLPLAWMDAMLRETPVLTNKISGVDELIKNDFNGMVFKDKLSLKKLLLSLNQNKLNNLKKNSQKTIQNRFNISLICESYYSYWKSILDKKK